MSISHFFGQCSCGAVKYSFQGEVERIIHCHCQQCRRSHAAPFVTRAVVDNFGFAWESGADQLGYYQSSGRATRTYCKQCATKLVIIYNDEPGLLGVPVGAIEGKLVAKERYHAYVKDKAPWYEIEDSLPQFDESAVPQNQRAMHLVE